MSFRYRAKRHWGWFCLLLMVLAACQDGSSQSIPDQTTPGLGVAITASNCPSSVVQVGDEMTWTNADDQPHMVRSTSTDHFDSGVLQPGDTFAFLFSEAGQYDYTCTEDGTSNGMVTVEP